MALMAVVLDKRIDDGFRSHGWGNSETYPGQKYEREDEGAHLPEWHTSPINGGKMKARHDWSMKRRQYIWRLQPENRAEKKDQLTEDEY